MNGAEFRKQYSRARRKYPKLTKKALAELKQVYKAAGKLAASQIRQTTTAELIDIQSANYAALQTQLQRGAQMVHDELTGTIPKTVRTSIDVTADIHKTYIDEAVANAKVPVQPAVIAHSYTAVNDRLIRDLVGRISSGGYSFSQRIWSTANDFPQQMNRVLSAGIAQGRDAIKIAQDIGKYIGDGKRGLVKTYGKLKRGTPEFLRRISDQVDWRALRLVRSELYMSLQNSSVAQGRANPGASGKFDWVLELARQHWGCACPELQAASPYEEDAVPGYPHPNCMCSVRPQLRDGDEFNKDLKKWADGEPVDYLDNWADTYYNPYNA